jgi:hypothetical protein
MVRYLFNRMCIPQQTVLGTDRLTLQLLVVGLSTLELRRSKGQMLLKVMIAEVIDITWTHTWFNSRQHECAPGSSDRTPDLGADDFILVPSISAPC